MKFKDKTMQSKGTQYLSAKGFHSLNIFNNMWIILEPVIFALIGTEIQVDKIDPEKVGLGILVLLGALAIIILLFVLAFVIYDLRRK